MLEELVMTLEGFRALGISEETIEALEKKGFTEPTPIQEKTIPLLLHGNKDIVGQAQTGTGKTAAFAIPIIEKFDPFIKGIQALILTPTRELALQITEEIRSLKGDRKMFVTTVYGGSSMYQQIKDLEKGTHVVVGTPGRVIDLIDRGKLKLEHAEIVVLDEADEMLNMGFQEDVETILKATPKDKRMLLFSATMPDRILTLAKRYMRNYEMIHIRKNELAIELIDQTYYEVNIPDKLDAVCRILDVETDFYGLIFCNTKADVADITVKLNEKGYNVDALHGDLEQKQREKVIKQFKTHTKGALIATDVAARGIDIQDLTHVINFTLPNDPEAYVHRIGRTGRAGKTGKAISLVPPMDRRRLQFIAKLCKANIKKAFLPDAVDMIHIKKERIKQQVLEILAQNQELEYMAFSDDLLSLAEPNEILAALMRLVYKNELDPKSYKKIRQETHNESSRGGGFSVSGKQRLFVAKGKLDGFNARKLLDMIYDETQVEGRKIDDIKILESFSFFTTNAQDAEMILETFKRKGKGKGHKSLVELAKPSR